MHRITQQPTQCACAANALKEFRLAGPRNTQPVCTPAQHSKPHHFLRFNVPQVPIRAENVGHARIDLVVSEVALQLVSKWLKSQWEHAEAQLPRLCAVGKIT
jgi:hypothetical protein